MPTQKETYYIRKCAVEINIPTADDPTALRQDLEWMVREDLMHALEEQLRSMDLQHLNLIIPKIHIDLNLTTDNWNQQFVSLCVEKVQLQIEQHLSNILPVVNQFSSPSESLLQSDDKSLFVSTMYQATLIERLIHFLMKGILPPGQGYYNLETFTDKLQEVIRVMTLQGFLQKLNPLLEHSPVARYRFLYAMPMDFSWRILQSVLHQQGIAVPDSGSIGINLSTGTEALTIRKLLALGLGYALNENITVAEQTGMERCVQLIAGITKHLLPVNEAEKMLRTEALDKNTVQMPDKKASAEHAHVPGSSGTEEQEGIFCANSGIVLMAAFLPAFFEGLQLLNEEGLFRDEQAQHKAVHLLYWMASGEDIFDESQSIIPKVLCGLAPDSWVDMNIVLSLHDTAEATDLLHNVMDYWQHNGKPIFHSIDGLRDHFLQRNGKLDTASSLHLTIEKAAIDILLSSLPWTYSMVKHRWMPFMLSTEW